MKALKVILVAIGSLFAIAGLALLVGGFALWGAYATQRDADGYFTAGTERFESSARAITTDELGLLIESDTPGWLIERLGSVRARAEAPEDVFIGIGPAEQVAAYLQDVAHDRVDGVDTEPFRVDYRHTPGDREPGPPAEQGFWVAHASGVADQTVTWDLESGRWVAVLMNADGSPGVAADVTFGAQSDLVGWALRCLRLWDCSASSPALGSFSAASSDSTTLRPWGRSHSRRSSPSASRAGWTSR